MKSAVYVMKMKNLSRARVEIPPCPHLQGTLKIAARMRNFLYANFRAVFDLAVSRRDLKSDIAE